MDGTEVGTKTEFAYRTLRQEILETRLMPGTPLKLSAMRDTYGIGWTPLREALSRLEAEHLVNFERQQGLHRRSGFAGRVERSDQCAPADRTADAGGLHRQWR
jgi:DNA-binding FadR family transcriptional regulator